MNYTKGPWKTTVFDDGDIFIEGRDYSRAAICKMLPPCGYYTQGETGNKIDISAENRLNAALIAAAPDMYEALRNLVDCAGLTWLDGYKSDLDAAMRAAHAALNKAEGME